MCEYWNIMPVQSNQLIYISLFHFLSRVGFKIRLYIFQYLGVLLNIRRY